MGSGDGIERIEQAIQTGRGRSPLYRWLRARHDRVQAALDDERADWTALALAFAELGLGGTVDQPMKPETVRHCWYRVRKAVAASRTKRLARGRVVIPSVSSPTPAPANDALAALRAEINARSGRT